ncbi:MAG: T9SS type A sorting domain-containing protein [Bacteroidota bacterium]
MMKSPGLLLISILFTSGFLMGQYCTTVGPNSTIDSNVETVQLNGVVGSINYTGCPGVVGLQDLTGTTMVTLNAGATYSITIEWGTCGGIFSGAGTAWIDYNGDNSFEATEIIATWQGSPPFTGVYSFSVPAGAQNGVTRMRVTQQEGTVLPLNPCATFSWGSVTDFGVTIGNGIDCTGYVGDDVSDPVIVTDLPYASSGDNSFCYANQNLVYSSPDVYYLLNPNPLMASISVSLCGSSFDTFLSVVDTDGNIIAFNDDAEGCGTSSSLTFNTEGLGQVYVIVEGWGSEMGEYDILIDANYVNIIENDPTVVRIHPNPSSGNLTVSGIQGAVYINDLSGKCVLSATVYDTSDLDVSGLSNGVYILRGTSEKGTVSKKFIVRK